MNQKLRIGVGLALLALLLAGGAFAAGRLLSAGSGGSGGGAKVKVASGNGAEIEAEWVRAAELPDAEPDVAGAFVRREDNRFFINETEGGFVLSKNTDGSLSVSNATGKVSEVVVTGETRVLVDTTLESIEEAISDGKMVQMVEPGSVEEIGDLSFVRAWGEAHGDRLVASVLLYSRPPVISR